jgi:hypothetical protein
MNAQAVQQGGGNSGSSADILVKVYVVGRSQKFGPIKLTPGDVSELEYQIYQKLPIELAGIGPTGFEVRRDPDTMQVYDDAKRTECALLTDPVVITPNTRLAVVPLNLAAAPVLPGQATNAQQQGHGSSALLAGTFGPAVAAGGPGVAGSVAGEAGSGSGLVKVDANPSNFGVGIRYWLHQDRVTVDEYIMTKALRKFGSLMLNAWLIQEAASPAIILDCYMHARLLPSATTVEALAVEGYAINGAIFAESPIHHCFDISGEPHIIKPICSTEHKKLLAFQQHLAAAQATVPSLATFRLYADPQKDKYFMIMPFYHCTLQVVPVFTLDRRELAYKLWSCLKRCLVALHALDYAHMDITPSNIACDGSL